MRRWLVAGIVVVALAAQVWVVVYAEDLLRYEAVLLVVAGIVLVGFNVVRTRRRGTTVAKTLSPDAPYFEAFQDDLLGRTFSDAGTTPPPAPTLVDDRGDPLDDFTQPAADPDGPDRH